jgi:hypothetical protein
MKFTKEFLQEHVLYGNEEVEDVFVVADNIIETTRWSEIHYLVFNFEGKLYQTTYSQGSTEIQDESPFEYEDDGVDCVEVEPYKATITKYKEV